jgi:23S rRNA pseudouridine1911/1915/1917 synthase
MIIVSKTFSREKFQAIFQVQEPEEGMRLDQFVMEYFSKWSRQMIKRKITAKDIFIKDRPGKNKPSTKVHTQDIVHVETSFQEESPEKWNGEDLPVDDNLPMVFSDDGLFVVSKPAFMAVHPTGRHIFHVVTVILEDIYNERPLHSVHRLDRETSGLLLVARNHKSANELTTQFEKGQVKKVYFFVGVKQKELPMNELFTCERRLGTEEEGLKRVYIKNYDKGAPEGKSAETSFLLLDQDDEYVIGLAFPQTGRQHQIRVHAQYEGFPLVGDKLYLGSYEMFQSFKDNYAKPEDYEYMKLPRHALHATGLKLNYHQKPIELIAPLAPDLIDFLKKSTNILIDNLEAKIAEEIKKYFLSL